MYYTNLLITSTLIFLVSACSANKNIQGIDFNEDIDSFMGKDYTSASNSSNTYLLTWNLGNSSETPVLKFAVWQISTGKQVYSGTAINGKVSWMNDTTLELHDYPGIIDDNNPLYKYKIDIKTKLKTALIEETKL